MLSAVDDEVLVKELDDDCVVRDDEDCETGDEEELCEEVHLPNEAWHPPVQCALDVPLLFVSNIFKR